MEGRQHGITTREKDRIQVWNLDVRFVDLFVVIIPIDLPIPRSVASKFGLEIHLLKVLIGMIKVFAHCIHCPHLLTTGC